MPPSTTQTALDLDAIAARAQATPEGPWRLGFTAPGGEPCAILYGAGLHVLSDPEIMEPTTAKFIVSARDDVPMLIAEVERLTAEIADIAAELAAGEASDGHHTHRELYEYRMLYNAHAAHGWLAAGIPVVKSWTHSDGEPCFGGGWFVVVATLPSGQISNHYRAEHWGIFNVPEAAPPEYDGHTPADAAARLRVALTEAGDK